MTYRINVKTIRDNFLVFKGVESYGVVDGFLTFIDSKTGDTKRFAVSNTEVEEE